MEGVDFIFTAENLSYVYKDEDIPVFENINFKINDGEFVCLMGPNGSGKSTLFQILEGFLKPTSGHLKFEGKDLQQIISNTRSKKKFHQKVGILFQNVDTQLFNSTVYDEIAFGPKQMNLSQTEINQRVEDCLKLFNLESMKDSVPYNLSGGEKREVALASVLSLNPEVILLDEPLVGLTKAKRNELINLFNQLHKAGKTIILITHYFQQVKNIATDYLIFENNNIIKKTSTELKQSPSLIHQVEEY